MLDIDDKDKKNSGVSPCGGKFLKRFLIILVTLLVLRLVFIRVEAAMEGITHHRYFMPILMKLRDNIVSYIDNLEKHENYSVINEKKFLSDLKETVYEPIDSVNMKKCFEIGIFKILIQENVCYIYVNLTKAGEHFSRRPLALRNSVAEIAASLAATSWGKTTSDHVAKILQKGGTMLTTCFLAKPDMKSLVLFQKEMDEFYFAFLILGNIPPLTLGEILYPNLR